MLQHTFQLFIKIKSLYSFLFFSKVQTKSCAEQLYLRDHSSLSWVCDSSVPLSIPCKIQILNCLVNDQDKIKICYLSYEANYKKYNTMNF